MSKATKRKHVTKEVLDDFVLPDGDHNIVRVMASRGNNLHEVEGPDGAIFLVSMPTKFRKNIWIKRGDYMLVAPIEEGDKVKGEIANILYKEQIKHIKDSGLWPSHFNTNGQDSTSSGMIPDSMLPPSDSEDSEGSELGGGICNPNRPPAQYEDSSDSSEEEEQDDCDADGSRTKAAR